MKEDINSLENWNSMFKNGTWEKNKGFEQSRYFAELIFKSLSNEVKDNMINKRMVDWACACGQATNFFSENIQGLKCLGYDFSEEAVLIAKKLFPFEWFTYNKPSSEFDIILMSHVLEHYTKEEGLKLVRDITSQCNKYIIISTPYMENPDRLIPHHLISIDDNYFPEYINNFKLKEQKIVDANNEFWNGNIITVVYEKA